MANEPRESDPKKGAPEALATFGKAAKDKGVKPPEQRLTASPDTSYKPGDLAAEQKDAAHILHGNATGDRNEVAAAVSHHAKVDKRGL